MLAICQILTHHVLSAEIDLDKRWFGGLEKGHQIQHEGVWEYLPEKWLDWPKSWRISRGWLEEGDRRGHCKEREWGIKRYFWTLGKNYIPSFFNFYFLTFLLVSRFPFPFYPLTYSHVTMGNSQRRIGLRLAPWDFHVLAHLRESRGINLGLE